MNLSKETEKLEDVNFVELLRRSFATATPFSARSTAAEIYRRARSLPFRLPDSQSIIKPP